MCTMSASGSRLTSVVARKAKAEVQREVSEDDESPSKKVKTEDNGDGDDRIQGLDEGSEADAPGEDLLG